MHILLEVNLFCRDLLKWNPVNTVSNGPKKLAVFMGDRINKGFFTRKKSMAVLPGGQKKWP